MPTSERLLVWLTTNPLSTWWIRRVASRLDPVLFRATKGRLTSFGPPSMPMLTLTMRGRRSGRLRSVHLASIAYAGMPHVVASALGQERHPAWRYNLEANPEVEVQGPGERYHARAEALDDAEKRAIWPEVHRLLPMMKVYEGRTARDIRVFRLRRIDA